MSPLVKENSLRAESLNSFIWAKGRCLRTVYTEGGEEALVFEASNQKS